jgi:hypothetical protein
MASAAYTVTLTLSKKEAEILKASLTDVNGSDVIDNIWHSLGDAGVGDADDFECDGSINIQKGGK